MKQIRVRVFETNSSSTHSLTICLKKDYNEWKSGKRVMYDDKLITLEELEEAKKNDKWFDEDDVKSHDDYWDDGNLEGFDESFITPSGEEVIAFGKYGYDG